MQSGSNINFGLLQQLPQDPSTTQVIQTPANSGGGLFDGLGNDIKSIGSGLKQLFGHNQVDVANQAITNNLQKQVNQSTQQPPISLGLLNRQYNGQSNPIQSPKQQLQGVLNTPYLSMSNIIKTAKEVYPDDPTMAKLAASQAVEESRLNGRPSTLASQYNNLFGIKGTGNAGSVTMNTHEYVNGHIVSVPQKFAAYKSPRDSFIAHRAMMMNERYSQAWGQQDLSDAAHSIAKGGYATDPNYASNLNLTFANSLAPIWDNQ
jgi:flagellum-specific peptidoglycan hydrolase FlgJ